MFNIGTGELLVIALVALIVLGPEKLPRAARQVGQFTAEARKIANGFRQEMQAAMDEVAQTADVRDDRDPQHRLSAPPADARPIDVPSAEARPLAAPGDPAASPSPAPGGNGASGSTGGVPGTGASPNGTNGTNGSTDGSTNGATPVAGNPDDPARA